MNILEVGSFSRKSGTVKDYFTRDLFKGIVYGCHLLSPFATSVCFRRTFGQALPFPLHF